MASLLQSDRNSKHNDTFKYKLDCQTLIDNHKKTNTNTDTSSDTQNWLHLVKQIEYNSQDYTLYNSLLEKNKQIVVNL